MLANLYISVESFQVLWASHVVATEYDVIYVTLVIHLGVTV